MPAEPLPLPGLNGQTISLGTRDSQVAGGIVFATVFLAIGIAGIVGVANGGAPGVPAIVAGILGIAGGTAISLWIQKLELFLASRTYRRTRGWRFSPTIATGSFDDISGLVLRKEQRQQGKHSVTVFPVYILWKNNLRHKDDLTAQLNVVGYDSAAQLLERFAQALDVIFRDETGRIRVDLLATTPRASLLAEPLPQRIALQLNQGTLTAQYPAVERKQAATGATVVLILILFVFACCISLPFVITDSSSSNAGQVRLVFGLIGGIGILGTSLVLIPLSQRIRSVGGTERLTLNSDGLTIQIDNSGKTIKKHTIPFKNLRELRVEPKFDNDSATFLARIAVGIGTSVFGFGEGLTDEERHWLALQVGDRIVALKSGTNR